MTDDAAPAEPEIPHDLRLKLPPPRVTMVLIALNVAAFVVTSLRGGGWVLPDPEQLIAAGGNLPVLTLNGEPWRLVSAMFLHAGLLHLGMNMLCLYPGGQSAEYMFGRRSFLVIYLVAGLVGGIVSTARTTMVVSVGASGAVFGVFGAVIAYLVAHRDQLEPIVRQKQLKSLGTFMAINLVLGVTAAGIDLAAHVGGLAAGFVIGYVADRRLDLSDLARAASIRIKRVLVAAALALVGVGVGLVALPGPGVAYMTSAEAKSLEQLETIFKRFVVMEKALLDKQRAMQERAQAEQITDAEMLVIVEDELLPPWRSVVTDLTSVSGLPAIVVPRQQLAVAYVRSRVTYLEAMAAILKLSPDGPEFEAARADLTAKEQAIVAALAALEQALK